MNAHTEPQGILTATLLRTRAVPDTSTHSPTEP